MSLNNMKNRLKYIGGSNQIDRMNSDKLKSLKKAMLYSYQAATAILSDGREFRCLINPNKINLDLDNKILSIPFKDKRLNGNSPIVPDPDPDIPQDDNEEVWEDMEDLYSVVTLAEANEGNWEDMGDEPIEPEVDPVIPGVEEVIGVKEGDIIQWKQNGSYWLVYLRRLEETAYFRADIRRCRYEIALGNGSKYWVSLRGPVEQSILWSQISGNYFNRLNYTLTMLITANNETIKYFNRFKKVMINNRPWEVQVVDSISTPGILEVILKETYSNTIETDVQKAVQEAEDKVQVVEKIGVHISGPDIVYPYDVHTYELKNYYGTAGTWSAENLSRSNMVKIKDLENNKIEVSIITGKSGSFELVYKNSNQIVAALNIIIKSL